MLAGHGGGAWRAAWRANGAKALTIVCGPGLARALADAAVREDQVGAVLAVEGLRGRPGGARKGPFTHHSGACGAHVAGAVSCARKGRGGRGRPVGPSPGPESVCGIEAARHRTNPLLRCFCAVLMAVLQNWVLLVGSGVSSIACLPVLITFLRHKSLRRHPNPIIFLKTCGRDWRGRNARGWAPTPALPPPAQNL